MAAVTSLLKSIVRTLDPVLYHPALRPHLQSLPYLRRAYELGWYRTHPIDRTYGIDTSGYVPTGELHPDASLTKSSAPYVGSQPSAIRWAFDMLGDVDGYAMVDVGCGKGRVLVVATEYPFRKIMGVDLSPQLVGIARRNAAAVAQAHPHRPSIEVAEADALAFDLPSGKAVLFLANPFAADIIAGFIANVRQQLGRGIEHAFVIYTNPTMGRLFDECPDFTRWAASTVANEAAERGYSADEAETVVVWQSTAGARPPLHAGADQAILFQGYHTQVRLAPL